MYLTCKRFNRTVRRWIDDAKESKKGRKRVNFSRRAHHPEMEEKLHDEYKQLRRKRAQSQEMVVPSSG